MSKFDIDMRHVLFQNGPAGCVAPKPISRKDGHAMLKEDKNIRQIPGISNRRWFSDNQTDLIVWENEAQEITGFQLCYGKGRTERALTWHRESGYSHELVDDGENRPFRYKSTPVLLPDGAFDASAVAEDFRERSSHIDKQVSAFVYARLCAYL
jgi:hypothetical protein